VPFGYGFRRKKMAAVAAHYAVLLVRLPFTVCRLPSAWNGER
jgi:hypothetical protein